MEPLRVLVDRNVPSAGGIERLAVPAAVAFTQPKASLLGHKIQFGGPAIADRQRSHAHAVGCYSDHRQTAAGIFRRPATPSESLNASGQDRRTPPLFVGYPWDQSDLANLIDWARPSAAQLTSQAAVGGSSIVATIACW
jgi:hypothetical protein